MDISSDWSLYKSKSYLSLLHSETFKFELGKEWDCQNWIECIDSIGKIKISWFIFQSAGEFEQSQCRLS